MTSQGGGDLSPCGRQNDPSHSTSTPQCLDPMNKFPYTVKRNQIANQLTLKQGLILGPCVGPVLS